MWSFERSVGAALRTGAAALVVALFALGEARSDGDPEAGLTQREFTQLTEIAPPPEGQVAAAAPVTAHNLTDAERQEMDRMHAIRLYKGKEWKRLSPEDREARIRGLREQM